MSPTSHPSITIRPLEGPDELDAAVALQGDVWGYSPLDTDSRAMLTVASRFSGQTLGAFHPADKTPERLIGFALAFASLPFGRLHSHRVGVHPDFQNGGVGRQLKLAQREDALARGVEIIQWTFDPLQARNAYFNIVRLGAVAVRYIPNLYGITTSPLHGGLPTDRLLVEWHLESERVKGVLAGNRPVPAAETREIRLPSLAQRSDRNVQAALRSEFLQHLSERYVATGFRDDGSTQTYLLEQL